MKGLMDYESTSGINLATNQWSNYHGTSAKSEEFCGFLITPYSGWSCCSPSSIFIKETATFSREVLMIRDDSLTSKELLRNEDASDGLKCSWESRVLEWMRVPLVIGRASN